MFCDIEGTLLVGDKVNQEVLEKLKGFSEIKPVTLWSGGDLEELKKKLVASGINYPLVSKDTFNGCKVEIIMDDLDEDIFKREYETSFKEYIQIG
ncbi:hypothetical protein C4572_01730 [Candidatus Parcubacteria bacterium]|nr:MAG: hypothetical protein C4572_01730 [Candidatus Parcubacteria bacterium]